MWEVPRWLVLVENQRQTQPIGHLEGILPNFGATYALRTKRTGFLYGISTDRPLPVRLGRVISRLLLIAALAVVIAIVFVAAWGYPPGAVPETTHTRPSARPTVARPSPTGTPTPSATPSTSPSAGQNQASTPIACPSQTGGSGSAQAQITAIRAAHQPGMDRIVFEFGPSSVGAYGLPPWSISVTNSFIGTSGKQVPVDGNAFQAVRFRNASTVDPATGRQTFTQTDIHPGLPLVRHIKLIDDFERVMTWGVGLERLACATVTELANPARLVVDLPTPP